MPSTPRENEPKGVQTRSQAAAGEDPAPDAGSSDSPAPCKQEMDVNVILVLLKEQARQQQEQARQQQEQARKIEEGLRRQEEQSKLLREVHETATEWKREMCEVQEKLIDLDIKFEAGLHDVRETIGTVKAKVETVKEEVDTYKNRLQKLEIKVASGTSTCAVEVPVSGGGRFKVPPFDGTSSWTAYKRQFESVSKANGWSKEQARTALTLALRDEALTILEALGEEETYDRLLEALEARYGDKHLEHVYRAQLKDRTQGRSETLQQWALEIEKLVRKAYQRTSASFVDTTLVQAFVDGIRDLEVRAAVRLGHHGSLKDAVAHALEVEAVRQDPSRPYRVREVSVREPIAPRHEFGPRCYHCGERGHIQTSCPKRSRRERDLTPVARATGAVASGPQQGNE